MEKLSIAFGRRTFPDSVVAVWGARLIWPDDLVHDRQDIAAHNAEDKVELKSRAAGTKEDISAVTLLERFAA